MADAMSLTPARRAALEQLADEAGKDALGIIYDPGEPHPLWWADAFARVFLDALLRAESSPAQAEPKEPAK